MDDDRNLLRMESNNRFQFLEVAHILPHSLTSVTSENTDLVRRFSIDRNYLLRYLQNDSKRNTLQLLNMFDDGITHPIDHPKIDSPINALILTHKYRQLFGAFKIYFEHTGNPYKYEIKSTNQKSFLSDPLLPVVRTLTFES
jgi:hypothetical protein